MRNKCSLPKMPLQATQEWSLKSMSRAVLGALCYAPHSFCGVRATALNSTIATYLVHYPSAVQTIPHNTLFRLGLAVNTLPRANSAVLICRQTTYYTTPAI